MLTGGGRSYTWNYDNKPSSITGTDGVTETYTYDADGARVKRTRAGVTTYYVGGSWEEDSTGLRKLSYLFGTQVIAQRDSSNAVTYFHSDNLGSISLATNSSQGVVSQQEFDPWGKVRSGNVSQTSMNYTGQKLDGTGLLFYNARYYDPGIGRFSSADTITTGGQAGLNRYSYVHNNPMNLKDSSGHCPEDRRGDESWCEAYDRAYNNGNLSKAMNKALEELAEGELNNLSSWLERGLKFANGNAKWVGDTLRFALNGLNRVYNAFYSKFGAAGVEGAVGRVFNGITIKMNNPDPALEGGRISSGCWNCRGDSTTLDLYYNPNDSYAAPGAALERLSNLVIHEVGHVVDLRLGSYSQQAEWKGIVAASPDGAPSNYRGANTPLEDFAETFTAWVNHNARNSGVYVTPFSPSPGRVDQQPQGGRENAFDRALGGL